MTEGFSDENIAMLDQQVTTLLGDAKGLHDVILRASEARMLGLAEAAVYKAIYGEFVAGPSIAGRKFFTDEDHNDWRDTPQIARVAHLIALATVELQGMMKANCRTDLEGEAAADGTDQIGDI